jgi:predicted permease
MLAAFSFNLPDETGKVLLAVLPVFCIAMIGIFMRKVNWLTEQADQSLLKITINVLSPALIFDSILNNDALKQFSNVIIPPLVGFGTVAMGIGVGWIFAITLKRPAILSMYSSGRWTSSDKTPLSRIRTTSVVSHGSM